MINGRTGRTLAWTLTLVVACALTPPRAVAQEEEGMSEAEAAELRSKVQNPVANLISVPFQNNTDFGIGEFDRTRNTTNIQPVIPFALGGGWTMVTRTIMPLISQPDVTMPSGSTFGLGDTTLSTFFVPQTKSGLTLGVGPVFLLPTRTDESLGAGRWGIGPAALVLVQPPGWTIGVLAQHIWSVGSTDDPTKPDVSSGLIQPFVNYNLPNRWYLVTAPIITANYEVSKDDRWLVPLGGGVGKIFAIGKRPINATMQFYYNVVKPDNLPAADWTLRLQLQLLFPQ